MLPYNRRINCHIFRSSFYDKNLLPFSLEISWEISSLPVLLKVHLLQMSDFLLFLAFHFFAACLSWFCISLTLCCLMMTSFVIIAFENMSSRASMTAVIFLICLTLFQKSNICPKIQWTFFQFKIFSQSKSGSKSFFF